MSTRLSSPRSPKRTIAISESIIAKHHGNAEAYVNQLNELDHDHDGEIDLDDVCRALDEINHEKREIKLLKWMLVGMLILCVVIVGATAGLTYAMISHTKDSEVKGSVLVSKNTGDPVKTGSEMMPYPGVAFINKTADDLAHLDSIVIVSDEESDVDYTVHRIMSIAVLKNNTGLRIQTLSGELVTIVGLGTVIDNSTLAVNASAIVSDGMGRKLLANEDVMPAFPEPSQILCADEYQNYVVKPCTSHEETGHFDAIKGYMVQIKETIYNTGNGSPSIVTEKWFLDLSNKINAKMAGMHQHCKTGTKVFLECEAQKFGAPYFYPRDVVYYC